MITFKLNGKKVQGEEGQYILQVAEKYGVEIPTLCHHKALEPAGMCRLCTVELFDGRRTRFVTACNYPIWEGMEIKTDTDSVHAGRKLIVELLLARCPDVPVIKELAVQYDLEEPRFKIRDDTCILCGLCTRICDKMGNSAIGLTGRGVEMKVDTPFHIQTEVCMACGACAFVCPTGHITLDKIKQNITKHTVEQFHQNMMPGWRPENRSMCRMPRRFPIHRPLTDPCVYILKPADVKYAPSFVRLKPLITPSKMKLLSLTSGPSSLRLDLKPLIPADSIVTVMPSCPM